MICRDQKMWLWSITKVKKTPGLPSNASPCQPLHRCYFILFVNVKLFCLHTNPRAHKLACMTFRFQHTFTDTRISELKKNCRCFLDLKKVEHSLLGEMC